MEKYVDLSIPEEKPKKKKPKKKPKKKQASPHDGIYEYAKETFTLGLLLKEYMDAVKESDDDRTMCVWKFLLPLLGPPGVPTTR